MDSRDLTLADALRLAINVLRDAFESRSTPSGFEIDAGLAQLHADAAEVLEVSLQDLKDHG
ncbi:hypothetical protein [Caballeronia sp. HLA56]